MPRNRIDRQPATASARLSTVPPVRFLLPALAAACLLIAGCASRPTSRRRSRPSSARRRLASRRPAGYACSSADLFTQPVGVPVRQQVTLGDTTAVLTGTSASDGVEPTALRDGVLTITRAGHTTVTLPGHAAPAAIARRRPVHPRHAGGAVQRRRPRSCWLAVPGPVQRRRGAGRAARAHHGWCALLRHGACRSVGRRQRGRS